MPKALDLTGHRFGLLEVVERGKNNKGNKAMWICKCDCGNMCDKTKTSNDLIIGKVISCGCVRKETAKLNGGKNKIYDDDTKRLRRIWYGMMQRCNYKHNANTYKNYGGRGIGVCEEWSNSNIGFKNFCKWSLINGYQKNLTIDRIEKDGNYEPNNCKWSTYKEQENNRRNNRELTINGITMTISEWAEKYKIGPATLKWRLDNGWSEEELFIKPKLNNKWRNK